MRCNGKDIDNQIRSNMPKYEFLSFTELSNAMADLCRQVAVDGFKPEFIIGPSRGGLLPGVMLSHYYNIPFYPLEWQTRDGTLQDINRLSTIINDNKFKNLLLVDDINDSGKTLDSLTKSIYSFTFGGDMRTATIYTKTTSIVEVDYSVIELTPDNEAWVIFPYEEWWR